MKNELKTNHFEYKENKNIIVNAMGPYTHGVWDNGQIKIGDEEALSGRAEHIIDVFVKSIQARYSIDQIKNMSLVDVGCYDGYLTVNIEKRLPFKKIFGIEPRLKNIEKGVTVRNFLRLDTKCEFKVGDIDTLSLGSENYDIVFCSGVFHHLIEIDSAIKKLKKICSKSIFIETQCYEPIPKNPLRLYFYNKKNERIIEPKDIIYKFLPKSYGLSGHKFETNYYDGSASGFSLVNIPSPEAVCMSLQSNNFTNVKVVSEPLDYKRSIKSNLRDFFAVCVFADNEMEKGFNSKISDYVLSYELGVVSTRLPSSLLFNLDYLACGGKSKKLGAYYLVAIYSMKKFKFIFDFLGKKLINSVGLGKFEKEILINIKYRPFDKVSFELAKEEIADQQFEKGVESLLRLIGKVNTDWRVSYRAFCLLSLLYKKFGDSAGQKYFSELCLRANGNYPKEILDSSIDQIFGFRTR